MDLIRLSILATVVYAAVGDPLPQSDEQVVDSVSVLTSSTANVRPGKKLNFNLKETGRSHFRGQPIVVFDPFNPDVVENVEQETNGQQVAKNSAKEGRMFREQLRFVGDRNLVEALATNDQMLASIDSPTEVEKIVVNRILEDYKTIHDRKLKETTAAEEIVGSTVVTAHNGVSPRSSAGRHLRIRVDEDWRTRGGDRVSATSSDINEDNVSEDQQLQGFGRKLAYIRQM